MAPTTPILIENSVSVSSQDQFLPPEWESTFLIYLLLPGLCAFFLFLVILLVAFKLIKPNKHSSTSRDRRHVGSFMVGTPDTSIYDVINESPGTSRVQSYRERNIQPETSNSLLQVCLPSPRDIYLPKGRGIVQSPLPSRHALHLSKDRAGQDEGHATHTSLAHGELDINIPSLVDYPEDDMPSVCHVAYRVTDSERHANCNSTQSCELESRSFVDDPIYESLDKTWIKRCKMNSIVSEIDGSDENDQSPCETSSCSENPDDPDMMDGQGSDHINCVTFEPLPTNDQIDCDYDHKTQSLNSSKPPIYSKTKKTAFNTDSRNVKDYDLITNVLTAQRGRVLCKLSIYIGTEKENLSKTKEMHYHYKINNIEELADKDANYTWVNRLNATQLFLSPENLNLENLESNQNNNVKFDSPLKLELLKSSSSLMDLMTNDDQPPVRPLNSPYKTTSIKGMSESCENLPRQIPNSSHKQKTEVKKSQSFKESAKYRKTGRSRKFSLGSLSMSHPKNSKEGEHHKSFDKLEVARILARLGPLPPIPKPAEDTQEDKLSSDVDFHNAELPQTSTSSSSSSSSSFEKEKKSRDCYNENETVTQNVPKDVTAINETITCGEDGGNLGVDSICEVCSEDDLHGVTCENVVPGLVDELKVIDDLRNDENDEGIEPPTLRDMVEESPDVKTRDPTSNHYFILEKVQRSCCSVCDTLEEPHVNSADVEEEKENGVDEGVSDDKYEEEGVDDVDNDVDVLDIGDLAVEI